MTYSGKLRAWAGDSGRLHERVVHDGSHHVWVSVFPGCRVDRLDRDFEQACRLVWNWLTAHGFTQESDSPPLTPHSRLLP